MTSGATAGPALPLRARAAVRLGAQAARLSRVLGAGTGGVIGGRVAAAIDPRVLPRLAAGRTVALVSGTNGKTTTTRMLVGALRTSTAVATNGTGANLPAGLVSALAASGADVPAVLEVDEQWLPSVMDATRPAVVVLLNLSRDQLDRVGEMRAVARAWRRALERLPGTPVVANADDPLVAWAAAGATDVTWVSVGSAWIHDAVSCLGCNGLIRFGAGGWRCTSCALHRPEPSLVLAGTELHTPGSAPLPMELGLPGRCNRANAGLAVAAAARLGVPPPVALAAAAALTSVGGRYARVGLPHARTARLLLAKNPGSWSETLEVLDRPPARAVIAVNDGVADGADVSWLWDVPFERLQGRAVTAAGTRALDVAVRLRYADVGHDVVEDPARAVADCDEALVDVVANYTAFHRLCRDLGVG